MQKLLTREIVNGMTELACWCELASGAAIKYVNLLYQENKLCFQDVMYKNTFIVLISLFQIIISSKVYIYVEKSVWWCEHVNHPIIASKSSASTKTLPVRFILSSWETKEISCCHGSKENLPPGLPLWRAEKGSQHESRNVQMCKWKIKPLP